MSLSASLYQSSAILILYNAQEAQDQCYEDVWNIHTRTSSFRGVSHLLRNPHYSKARCSRPADLALLPLLGLGSFARFACVQFILTAMTTLKAAFFPSTRWLLILKHRKLRYIDSAISCHPEETGTHKSSRRNGMHLKPSISSPCLFALYAGNRSGDASFKD